MLPAPAADSLRLPAPGRRRAALPQRDGVHGRRGFVLHFVSHPSLRLPLDERPADPNESQGGRGTRAHRPED